MGDPTVREAIPWQLQALRSAKGKPASPAKPLAVNSAAVNSAATKPSLKGASPSVSTSKVAKAGGKAPSEATFDRTVLQPGMDVRMAELVLAEASRADVPAPSGPRVLPALPADRPPESGVRITYVEPEPAPASLAESLSFQVYTVDQLERRTGARPNAPKIVLEAPPEPWRAAWHGVRVFLREAFRWVVSGPTRGVDARTALGAPYAAMVANVRAFVRATDWRRIGVGLGVGVATVSALVFVVVTVAELTDDLKPASKRSVHLTTASLAASAPKAPVDGTPATPRPSLPASTSAPTTMTNAPISVAPRAPLLPASVLDGAARADSSAIAPPPVRETTARGAKGPARRDAAEVFTP